MKIYLYISFIIIFICSTITLEAQDSVIDTSWDLTRDISDFAAGRLKYRLYPGTILSPKGENGPVEIFYTPPNPNFAPPPFFAFSFPRLFIRKNLTINLEFEWPSSYGYLLMLFTAWYDEKKKDKLTGYSGIMIEYATEHPGLYIGNLLPIFEGKEKKDEYDYTSVPLMGNDTHKLSVTVDQNIMSAVLDGDKSVSWTGKTAPAGFYISGVYMYPANSEIPAFTIHNLSMKVNLNIK